MQTVWREQISLGRGSDDEKQVSPTFWTTSVTDILNFWIQMLIIHRHLLWFDLACLYLLWSLFASIVRVLFTFGMSDYSLNVAFALFTFGVIDYCVNVALVLFTFGSSFAQQWCICSRGLSLAMMFHLIFLSSSFQEQAKDNCLFQLQLLALIAWVHWELNFYVIARANANAFGRIESPPLLSPCCFCHLFALITFISGFVLKLIRFVPCYIYPSRNWGKRSWSVIHVLIQISRNNAKRSKIFKSFWLQYLCWWAAPVRHCRRLDQKGIAGKRAAQPNDSLYLDTSHY